MNQNLQQQTGVRSIDPNVLQRRASDPQRSVWVSASAGSGKTKVLTDRILRLLLPDNDGLNQTQPHKILAITFTKAAASEMLQRINKRLSEWAIMDDETLEKDLKKLIGNAATVKQKQIARQLFAEVIDIPGGMNIMTIHAFCQSILGRFPLEAGIPPHFDAIEEDGAADLIEQARNTVISRTKNDPSSPISSAIFSLYTHQNEEQLTSHLNNILSEKKQFQSLLQKLFGIDGLYTSLCQNLKISPGTNTTDCLNDFFELIPQNKLKDISTILESSKSKNDQKLFVNMDFFLNDTRGSLEERFSFYKSFFLTAKSEIRKTPVTKSISENYPDIIEFFQEQAEQCLEIDDILKRITTADLTRDLFCFAEAVLNEYQTLKDQKNVLDFDDLILKTLDLLAQDTIAPWIRYKLDEGIDHILVDEAQDTNPEQWQIIQHLCDDFFDGQTKEDISRTIFVVGDEKQSIYSFQRAAPEKFTAMRDFFEQKINTAQKDFSRVDFNVSFRSVPSVLKLVDTVFEDELTAMGINDTWQYHEAFRRTQAGLVEVWPLFEKEKTEDIDFWQTPFDIAETQSGASKMANHIGNTIAEWLETKENLESYDRPIKPSDIMILVRSRTAFMDQLVRSLKIRDIPVSGVDRMVLSEQLAVQDILAAIQCALLPEDDLNLAGFLKSPFIGFNDDQLFDIAHNRTGSLWNALKHSANTNVLEWIDMLVRNAGHTQPYQFINKLLERPCPADSISGLRAIKTRIGQEAIDPINELLNQALNYERDNIPTLQDFVGRFTQNTKSLKRQMEEEGNAVRIMTVHAAKGLQAPIVILPDTIRIPASRKPTRILWPAKTGNDVPLFLTNKEKTPSICRDMEKKIQAKEDEEYRRLLYVAMTRAENRLYMGGYTSNQRPLEESWYFDIERAFKKLEFVEDISDGSLRYTNPETDKPDRKEEFTSIITSNDTNVPNWLFTSAADEAPSLKTITPSRMLDDEDIEISLPSPSNSEFKDRFQRGNIIHKLLQLLPDLPIEKREEAALRYVAMAHHGLNEKTQKEILDETMAVLNDEIFAPIFGAGSQAEVPVMGKADNNTLISGQIDRLLVTDNTILFIDYKTGRMPPDNQDDIPLTYRHQMQCYAKLLRQIYPDKELKGALLWTYNGNVTEIHDL